MTENNCNDVKIMHTIIKRKTVYTKQILKCRMTGSVSSLKENNFSQNTI